MKSPRGTDVITHNGGKPYIQSDLYVFPQEQVVLFITSNNGACSRLDFSEKMVERVFAAE